MHLEEGQWRMASGILIPWSGIEPQQCKGRVLTTAQPGKFLTVHFYKGEDGAWESNVLVYVFPGEKCHCFTICIVKLNILTSICLVTFQMLWHVSWTSRLSWQVEQPQRSGLTSVSHLTWTSTSLLPLAIHAQTWENVYSRQRNFRRKPGLRSG